MNVFVATGSTLRIDRYYENSLLDLAIAAVSELEEELSEHKPDVLLLANAYGESTEEQVQLAGKLARALGYRIPAIRVENGDASGGSAIYSAYSLVKSGTAKSVLVVGAEKLGDFPASHLNDILAENLDEEFSYRAGVIPQAFAAIQMKLYMKRYNVPREYFAEWPYLMHKYASENHYAYLKFPVDKETILSSQVVSDPLRLFDTAARADGASAVLITNEEVARKVSEAPVKVEGVSFSTAGVNLRELLSVRDAVSPWREFKPDFYEIHDSYSVTAAMILDELGLERGKSLLHLDQVQVNYSGGLKARGYPGGATGVYQVAEGYAQLTGTFKGRRVKDARRGLVVSMDDLGSVAVTVALSR
ncbi:MULTISPECIES: thiolase family protein [Metallosphaera]|uniref:thiolase family protein n=1 Tax=Metallosphaera TaxID=41980 RepID=UPI001F056FFB|nr:thiolase family protein [Metallosphaera sedula]MCH1771260.1 thiolase family protein [Metallosphaera sedula]MCP6729650.1 thiolase family protein [Metallosphaera sedula]